MLHIRLLTLLVLLVAIINDAVGVAAAPVGKKGGFVYTTCKRGFEKLFKLEVMNTFPDLKFAFSRPGLITWKAPDSFSTQNFNLPASKSYFVRSFGSSVMSQATNVDDILNAVTELRESWQISSSSQLRLHVFGREEELALKSEHPQVLADRKHRIDTLRNDLLGSSDMFYQDGDEAKDNEVVLDVIVGEENEKTFVGCHIHDSKTRRSRYPNNLLPFITLPPEAPSRAYMKIEEAISYLDIRLSPGDVALEIGSAPGGCVYSLLQRGLTVVGVDPCPSDRTHAPILHKNPAFTEIKSKLHQLSLNQLPETVQWLLCDANIDALDALPHLKNICKYLHTKSLSLSQSPPHSSSSTSSTLPTSSSTKTSVSSSKGFKGLIYTSKLNDEVFALQPHKALEYIKNVKEELLSTQVFDEKNVIITTLPSNRQEVLIYAPVKNMKMKK